VLALVLVGDTLILFNTKYRCVGETFYSLLGVAGDADTETIRRAYREVVKECHPDVADDPAAPETFKRLTTARDVLVDEHERARYDRLGHDTYVQRHVDSNVWTAESGSKRTRTDDSGSTTGTVQATWIGDTGRRHNRAESGPGTGTVSGPGHRHAKTAVNSATTNAGTWHRASAVYRRVRPERPEEASTIQQVSQILRAAGPWLLVYLVLLASTFATGWFTYGEITRSVGPTVTLFSLGVLGVGVAVTLSIIHFVSQLYG